MRRIRIRWRAVIRHANPFLRATIQSAKTSHSGPVRTRLENEWPWITSAMLMTPQGNGNILARFDAQRKLFRRQSNQMLSWLPRLAGAFRSLCLSLLHGEIYFPLELAVKTIREAGNVLAHTYNVVNLWPNHLLVIGPGSQIYLFSGPLSVERAAIIIWADPFSYLLLCPHQRKSFFGSSDAADNGRCLSVCLPC